MFARGTFVLATWLTLGPHLSNSRMGAEHRPLWPIYGACITGPRRSNRRTVYTAVFVHESVKILHRYHLFQSEDAYPLQL
jgi:hypothetical protein